MPDPDRDIPPESRMLVEGRDGHRCVRCSGRGSDWHHRRSRRVRAGHRHCSCNGLLLCRTCHTWAHRFPDEARAEGYVVSQWVDEPFMVPVLAGGHYWQPSCNGRWVPLKLGEIVTDGFGGLLVSQMGQNDGLNEGHKIE